MEVHKGHRWAHFSTIHSSFFSFRHKICPTALSKSLHKDVRHCLYISCTLTVMYEVALYLCYIPYFSFPHNAAMNSLCMFHMIHENTLIGRISDMSWLRLRAWTRPERCDCWIVPPLTRSTVLHQTFINFYKTQIVLPCYLF